MLFSLAFDTMSDAKLAASPSKRKWTADADGYVRDHNSRSRSMKRHCANPVMKRRSRDTSSDTSSSSQRDTSSDTSSDTSYFIFIFIRAREIHRAIHRAILHLSRYIERYPRDADPVLVATPDCIARSHEGFLKCNGIMEQVVRGIRNAQNTSNNINKFHGKMRFAKNSPRILGLNELADDGSFIVHWSRWDPVSNPLDWSTGLDHIVRELSDISIGQRLALQVNNATLRKKVDAGIKQLENALLTKKVVVAIAEERYPISSYDGIEEYSFLIIDVHGNPVELKAVHVMHEVELKAIPRACMTCINLFAMST